MKLRILIMGTLLISFGMSQTLEETLTTNGLKTMPKVILGLL